MGFIRVPIEDPYRKPRLIPAQNTYRCPLKPSITNPKFPKSPRALEPCRLLHMASASNVSKQGQMLGALGDGVGRNYDRLIRISEGFAEGIGWALCKGIL